MSKTRPHFLAHHGVRLIRLSPIDASISPSSGRHEHTIAKHEGAVHVPEALIQSYTYRGLTSGITETGSGGGSLQR